MKIDGIVAPELDFDKVLPASLGATKQGVGEL